MIVLGYAGINMHLREDHIFMSRTCRMATLKAADTQLAIDMMQRNLEDLLKILKWNKEHKIIFFRMSSDFAPHITNPEFLQTSDRSNFRKLVYDPSVCKPILQEIGKYARDNGLRLTFHPDPYIVLGTLSPETLTKSKRELYFHTRVLDLMGLDYNSVIVLHGGGTYGNKKAAIGRWITNFNSLPVSIKRRIVLENDEYSYNTSDVLAISGAVEPFSLGDEKVQIPVVFDTFHYECYDKALAIRWKQQGTEGRVFEPDQMNKQLSVKELLPQVSKTWGSRIMKMHISNQRPDSHLGAHSDYITRVPEYLFTINKILNRNRIDLMVEAKMKEKAVLRLRKKYPELMH
jgi:UV DNA damage endonuclease